MPATLRPMVVLDVILTGTIPQTVSHTAVRPYIISDFTAVPTAADALSTAILQRNLGAVSNAVVFTGATGPVGRATALLGTEVVVAVGNTIDVVFNAPNSTTAGHAYVWLLPTAITGA